MSVYQGIIVLLVLFVICLIMSFGKVKSRKRTLARIITSCIFVVFVGVFALFKNELSELDKCKQSYHGFYVSNSLCYNTTNVSHDYLEGHGVNISAVMYLSEKTAEIITTDGRTIIVAKSPDGFSFFPQR
ncbi:hypothetical protein HV127_17275 [Klebsiella sp. RHBSTW-00215]|uniref:hypothetical protein n=1 Tax=Klebsiella sp. RHBSTW-00215 TaxID=2742640 RepID=UPI0015F4E1DF|nr:hypothetical protein [Klebsiella sp. RHBSTW-00215]MBA7932973.1 hypothetical protein [Klebsiella sp. RHBSTW-00215]